MTVKNLWSLLLRKSKLYRYRSIFRVLFWLALIGSYVAAVLPQDMAPTIGPLSDKAHHVLAFVILGLLLRLAYQINYWYALVFLVGYGAFIEFSQLYAVNRSAEMEDVTADLIGSFIGLKLYKYLRKVI